MRNANPEALQTEDWQIVEEQQEDINRLIAKIIPEREKKLKKWRDDNGVWGDG